MCSNGDGLAAAGNWNSHQMSTVPGVAGDLHVKTCWLKLASCELLCTIVYYREHNLVLLIMFVLESRPCRVNSH